MDNYRDPRISFEVSAELKARVNAVLGHTYGLQKAVFTAITEDMLDIMESSHGPAFIGGIVHRNIHLSDFFPLSQPINGDNAPKVGENTEDQ